MGWAEKKSTDSALWEMICKHRGLKPTTQGHRKSRPLLLLWRKIRQCTVPCHRPFVLLCSSIGLLPHFHNVCVLCSSCMIDALHCLLCFLLRNNSVVSRHRSSIVLWTQSFYIFLGLKNRHGHWFCRMMSTGRKNGFNPFRTPVPFWGQLTWN